MRRSLIFFTIICNLCTCSPCASATIDTYNGTSEKDSTVFIIGAIETGDDIKFEQLTRNLTKATVVLQSPGGLVSPALSIGAQIYSKKFSTAVSSEQLCGSACALIWLAGNQRFMSRDSKIGFHAAYTQMGNFVKESGVANAKIGAYLNQLGFSLAVVEYITTPGPKDIQWLSIKDAIVLGINVRNMRDFSSSGMHMQNLSKEQIEGEIAFRAANEFKKQYAEVGILGLNTQVVECYNKAIREKLLNKVEYCFIIDFMTSNMEEMFLKSYGKEPMAESFLESKGKNLSSLNEATSIDIVNSRLNDAFDGLGVDTQMRGDLTARWTSLASMSITQVYHQSPLK
jgi:hypothetical protein